MGNPYSGLHRESRRIRERAANAVARLEGQARHPQRDLQALADCWFRPGSCFGTPELTAPTTQGVDIAARYLDHTEVEVAVAAASAVRAAVAALSHAGGSYEHLPWPSDKPAAAGAMGRALQSPHARVRLVASATMADHPARKLNAILRACLADSAYTVRWNAIRALAKTDEREGLREVLRSSLPRGLPPKDHFYSFWEAADALGESAGLEALLRAR